MRSEIIASKPGGSAGFCSFRPSKSQRVNGTRADAVVSHRGLAGFVKHRPCLNRLIFIWHHGKVQVLIHMVFALLQNKGREANFFTSPQLKVDEDK